MVPGDQVEGSSTDISGAGGEGRREWNLVQVDRRSKTGIGGDNCV